MEQWELDLINKLLDKDEELKNLWEEHLKLEAAIEEFNKRVYLTPEEEAEKQRLKKIKLAGKDRMHEILNKYRKELGE